MNPEEKDDDISIVEAIESESVDVEGESKDLDSTKDDEKPKVAQKTKVEHKKRGGGGKRGNDGDVRIKELWAKAKEKEAMLAHAQSKNAEYEKITASALEESINYKRELLKDRIVRAKEADDSQKEAELLAELSKVDAQAAQIDRYKLEKSVNQQEKPRPQQEQEYDYSSQSPASFDDIYERQNRVGKEWLEKNKDWYDSDADDYDEDKVSDVTYYAQSLEANFARSGTGFPPGSKGYFAAIDKYIKENWSDNQVTEENNDEQEISAPKSKHYAAPVGNRNASPNNPVKKKEYKITRDEREMAIHMKMKGKDGRELPDDEKIKRFVQLRETTPQSGPISIKDVRR